MPFKLQEITDSSFETQLATARHLAHKNEIIRAATFPLHDESNMVAWYIALEHSAALDPLLKTFAILETESKEVAAWARWRIPSTWANAELEQQQASESRPTMPEGSNEDVLDLYWGNLAAAEKKYANPERDIVLTAFLTHPAHQKKGYASMLIEQLVDTADERKARVFVAAMPAARSLYARVGFKEVDKMVTDLSSYGVNNAEVLSVMIRDPS